MCREQASSKNRCRGPEHAHESSESSRICSFSTADIKYIRDTGTYDSAEVLDEAQMKISQINMSKILFTKKNNPDGSFHK